MSILDELAAHARERVLADSENKMCIRDRSKTNSEVSLDMLNKVLPKLESLPEWTNDAIHDMLVSDVYKRQDTPSRCSRSRR